MVVVGSRGKIDGASSHGIPLEDSTSLVRMVDGSEASLEEVRTFLVFSFHIVIGSTFLVHMVVPTSLVPNALDGSDAFQTVVPTFLVRSVGVVCIALVPTFLVRSVVCTFQMVVCMVVVVQTFLVCRTFLGGDASFCATFFFSLGIRGSIF